MTAFDTVASIAKRISENPPENISGATALSDFDFDSLDLLEFQMEIDEAFKITIDLDEFLECESLQDIVNLVSDASTEL